MVVAQHNLHFCYFTDDIPPTAIQRRNKIQEALLSNESTVDANVDIETCYHLIVSAESQDYFEALYMDKIVWLLSDDAFNINLRKSSRFLNSNDVIEIGPRIIGALILYKLAVSKQCSTVFSLAFPTSFSTNAVSAFIAAGIHGVKRIEKSIRYMITCSSNFSKEKLQPLVCDPILECKYTDNMSFEKYKKPEKHCYISAMTSKHNIKNAGKLLGFELDDEDTTYYYDLFVNVLKRNPTDVELYDLALANAEENRHSFFTEKLVVDRKERNESLLQTMQSTQQHSNSNNLIAFSKNGSVIRGFKTHCLKSLNPVIFSEMDFLPCTRHIVYSSKTHNYSSSVFPFLGAATGTGERIRNLHATGRGAHEIAAIAGYSVGDLHLKNYPLCWEHPHMHPDNIPLPKDSSCICTYLQILIEASNGASDYGNRFGEPIICGFARTFGQTLSNGERCEYLKPIIYSGGIGSIDDVQIKKLSPTVEAWLVKLGGPAYGIGLSKDSGCKSNLNYEAVQRSDPEMEQKLHRVIRNCIEFGDENPLISVYDQGSGGNGKVLKELIGDKYGATIEAGKFEVGDPTLSLRELWCAEYQENDAALVDPRKISTLEMVAKREKCNVSFIGRLNNTKTKLCYTSTKDDAKELIISSELAAIDALSLVLRLPSVASKRYLTNKADRSVTGLIARQQCVGPLQTPVADVGVVALSHWDSVGAAVAVGEQPIKGLLSPEAGARMSLAEALTNIVFAPITDRKDIKCNCNWMWAAEVPGEGARLARACDAVCKAMKEVGVAIDSVNDSLSLSAKVQHRNVKAPGTFVVSAHAPCVNICKVVTPDLKGPLGYFQDIQTKKSFKLIRDTETHLIYIRFGNNGLINRLGGTALAQCLSQIGETTCDIEDFEKFGKAFDIVQKLIKEDRILSGHDVSDGGLITCALEMAIAGNRTMILQLMSPSGSKWKKVHKDVILNGTLENLFAEEAGIIIEIEDKDVEDIITTFSEADIFAVDIGFATGETGPSAMVIIKMNFTDVLHEPVSRIRNMWEETSNQLELLQTNPECVLEQKRWLREAINPIYKADFVYANTKIDFRVQRMFKKIDVSEPYSVAIVRDEGSNGDREMAAAFHLAGFAVHDLTMEDFLDPHFSLRHFNGLVFTAGFTYADALGAGKGWAARITYDEKIRKEIESFRNRSNTFSLGVSNGCQLMARLGWIGMTETNEQTVQLKPNDCGRFQSSFNSVKISKSPSIFFSGMENSILGVWSANSEGKFCFKNEQILNDLETNSLVPVYYCNARGIPTMRYPENPSGSTRAIAAITSADGRHLAMMPHPERSFLSWQWPYYPREWTTDSFNSSPWTENYEYKNSPWMRMFLNAYNWTHQNVSL
uniref:Glutamine amidotransferase type-1 domain-containing protein n=1 Tax=Syphacia muris TaxID=451379 RepID=A0A0N5AFB3_9BILA